jgi:hypothetical protein
LNIKPRSSSAQSKSPDDLELVVAKGHPCALVATEPQE